MHRAGTRARRALYNAGSAGGEGPGSIAHGRSDTRAGRAIQAIFQGERNRAQSVDSCTTQLSKTTGGPGAPGFDLWGKIDAAEWILSFTTNRARAGSTAGDLLEESLARGSVWFWWNSARTTTSLVWRELTLNPLQMTPWICGACPDGNLHPGDHCRRHHRRAVYLFRAWSVSGAVDRNTTIPI